MAALTANIEEQLEECESLTCIFEAEGDAVVLTADADAVSHLSEWKKRDAGTTGPPPTTLSYTAKVPVPDQGEGVLVELSITLPHEYPSTAAPHVLVRCGAYPKTVADTLQERLHSLARDDHGGECCLFQLIDTVPDSLAAVLNDLGVEMGDADNGGNKPSSSSNVEKGSPSDAGEPATFMRQFIYFHHIYNKSKRRDIVYHAHDLGLTGFSVIGKPGLVCVEGDKPNVVDYVQRLRRLPWQKMQTKVTQESECRDVDACRRFGTMHELLVDAHGPRGNHADMGQVRQYLEQHDLGDVFSQIFSVGST